MSVAGLNEPLSKMVPPDTNVSVPVYGRIPARQRQAKVRLADDMLVVTINY